MFVQRFANNAHASIHHVRRSHNIRPCSRVRDGLLGKNIQRGIVGHFAVFNYPAMPVVRVFTQANIGYYQQFEFCLANRLYGTLHHAIRGNRTRAPGVLFLRQPEQNYSRNSQRFDFAAFFDNLIGRLLKHSRHGADFLPYLSPGAHKHRIDQSCNAQSRFANQSAQPFIAAQSPPPVRREAHS